MADRSPALPSLCHTLRLSWGVVDSWPHRLASDGRLEPLGHAGRHGTIRPAALSDLYVRAANALALLVCTIGGECGIAGEGPPDVCAAPPDRPAQLRDRPG